MAANSLTALQDALADELTPVAPKAWGGRVAAWLIAGMLGDALAVALIGTRDDLDLRLDNPRFAVGILAFAAGFVLASVLAFVEAAPGRKAPRGVLWGNLLLLATLGYAGSIGAVADYPESSVLTDLACCLRLAVGCFVANVVALYLLSRWTPTPRGAVVAAVMAASTCAAALGGQLNCALDTPRHVLLGHALMFVLLNAATYGIYLGVFRRLCKGELALRLIPRVPTARR
jgi:hypothetical protein